MSLIWLFDCTKDYAELHKGDAGVVIGAPKTDDTKVGYYVESATITRCLADMEYKQDDNSNADL